MPETFAVDSVMQESTDPGANRIFRSKVTHQPERPYAQEGMDLIEESRNELGVH